MKKYLFLFFFSDVLLFAFGGGTGEKDNPFQIWNKDHLEELSDSVYNDAWRSECWHCDKYFRLMQDIYDVDKYVSWFYGYFYGNLKKITINTAASYPFFSAIDNEGVIDSLITDSYINNIASGIVGGLVRTYSITGPKDPPILSNCINNINDLAYSGIAGQNMGGLITHCLNNGSVSGVDAIAGITGNNEGRITYCINTGKISGKSSLGGIVGITINGSYVNQGVLNCINTGDVEGQERVGGIFGYGTRAVISNCINSGYIKGEKAVGGILGFMYNSSATISNCVNVGVVEGEEEVGGIVGKE